jgi:hypothetical protein
MGSHASHGRLRGKIKQFKLAQIQKTQFGFSALLPEQTVNRAMDAEGIRFRDCLFTPLITLWMFLAQVLSADGSCREATAKLLAFLATQSGAPVEPGADPATGPYCKARKRLAEKLVARLARDSGQQLHRRHPSGQLLGGRRVKVADGTVCSMPDTALNQQRWPQPKTQKPGLGFPLVRLVAIISLNCAAVLDVAAGPYAGKQTGEMALLRTMLDKLEKDDVLLADRYYASFWMIALLLGRGVDSLFRQHQHRKIDFRTGQRLGRDDHLIELEKPAARPDWMDQATYDQLPEKLTVREVRVRVYQKGFRVKTLVLVTTLLDAKLYSREEIAETFRHRWHVELDLRSIKQTMNMSVLRCKSPDMVRKEIWMHLLAYNLIRTVMAQAAEQAGVQPREVSFAGAVQSINAFVPMLAMSTQSEQARLMQILLRAIAAHRVGDRPDRYEPRAVKRRAKPIALLSIPRTQARKRLARSGDIKC